MFKCALWVDEDLTPMNIAHPDVAANIYFFSEINTPEACMGETYFSLI